MIKTLSELKVWEGNYNQGDIGAIATSLAKFGYNRSIAVWQDNEIRAGNHTYLALCWLKKQGNKPPQNVTEQNGDWLIEVGDCSHLSDKEAIAYAIADNRTAELASQDEQMLAGYLTELAEFDTELFTATGYDNIDVTEMMSEFIPEEESAPTFSEKNFKCPKCGHEWSKM